MDCKCGGGGGGVVVVGGVCMGGGEMFTMKFSACGFLFSPVQLPTVGGQKWSDSKLQNIRNISMSCQGT